METNAMEDIHPHCMNCIKFKKCNVKYQQGLSCEIIYCPLNCGMVFHACKKTEHLLLCPNEKVSCYNAESGCPCKMPRKNLGKHLVTCPASVVHCTMEWNRWRLDASNKEKLLLYTNTKKSQRPLDIALALRDQRMLKWHTSSDHLQKTIRTDFWYYPQRIYPVKPSTSVQGRGQDGSSGITIAKTIRNESGEISSHKQPSSTSNSCKMQITSGSKSTNNHTCSGTEVISNGHCSDENKENLATLVNQGEIGCSSSLHKISESCNGSVIGNGSEESKRNELNGCDNWKKISSENSSNESDFDENFVNAILSCPTRYLGLGPCIEPPEKNYVYTFLCSQEFRRDEYPWHYKNVHSDIHGGLNGWLQERCPLAQYGCTFSRQQLNPLPKGSRIVYNEILESFGISPPPHQEGSGMSSHGSYSLSFFDLPFEVLQHIARFLDSFSLSNLSHTCQLMQAVCQSLLVERGIVTIHWELKKENGVMKWKDTGKKWCFSSHFTPVHDWTFDEGSSMSNHLKSCKFYNRIKKTEPYLLPMGEPCWKLFEKLKQSALNWTSENLMTKL